MGLLRREILQRLGGWSEWCITEDAEASLRILREGYEGLFVPRSYGRGIMPLTFASLKSQRFRWCFGGMQILRMHRRSLMPWNRDPANGLSTAQRLDYLLGGLQWLNDLVLLGFSVVLLSIAAVFLVHGSFPLRPLLGAAAVLPVALIASGLLRALWALRERARIGTRRAVLAFANWLSLSWTVALACLNGLIRREGVFLRTPKQSERPSVLAAVWAARTETALACVLWAAGAALVISRHAGPLLVLLFAWQGAVYATAPFMAWMNQHTELSAQLERRRRSEYLRERAARVAPAAALVSGVGVLTGGVIAVAIVLAGTTSPPTTDPATRAGSGSGSPVQTSTASGGPSGGTVTPSADATVTPSSGPSSPSATQTPTSTPSPTGSLSPSSTPSATSTPSPTTSPSPTATPSATTSGGASVSPSATAGPGP
jgi:hypothetical protein